MASGDSYRVESKEEVRKLSAAGEVEVWYRIWATSAKGTYFHVDVPEDKLETAAALLAQRAKVLDAI